MRLPSMLAGLVGQRRGGRLVDDAHHLQPGDLAGLARRLALGVGEVGRHRDHRLAHRLPQPALRDVLQRLRMIAEISCGV